LEKADQGNLKNLVDLFVRIEKKSFLSALSLSESVLRDYRPLKDVISSALDRLQTRQESREEDKGKVFQHAEELVKHALEYCKDVAGELESGLHSFEPSYRVSAESSLETNDFWFKKQIIEVAKTLDYFADTGTYRRWVRLVIREERTVDLVVSFHSLGFNHSGMLVASAFLEFRQKEDDGTASVEGPHILCEEPFEFSYFDSLEQLVGRFDSWLKKVVLTGVDGWRRQL
jgi:hypothetical protein